MPDQVSSAGPIDAQVAPGLRATAWRLWILADAAWRLGPRPVALRLADIALRRAGFARRRLAASAIPPGRFLPRTAPPPPTLPPEAASRVLVAARALPAAPDWHGGFDPAADPLVLVLHRHGGARPVWEASRLAALPLLAQAARLDPGGGHLDRAEALLGAWCRANPPFRGLNWACGQEAALRALHLALALALLEADRDPPPASRALLAACATRIAATPLYALAQDNNHPLSEAAGAFACALLLGRDTRHAARRLAAGMARLVAPDGGFAQVSPGYARLLLDTLSVVEWLRRRHGAPPFPAPLAARAAALAAWLHRLADPATGATPPLGLEDGSCLADLSLAGTGDARASVERAARLFAGRGGDAPDDAGCAWLGLAPPAAVLDRPAHWQAEGTMGWRDGRAAAVLRTGPLRFRPGQCDLLHISLRDGEDWVIRDGGTGSYDPPEGWWWHALAGAAGHDAPVFDGADPMPRAGRFLLARWPRMTALADGAALRDAHGNMVVRTVRLAGRVCTVEDRLEGPFRRVAWHWRLCAGPWRLTADGAEGPAAGIAIEADAALGLALGTAWESPRYGAIRPAPLLRIEATAPVSRVVTRIRLP